MLRFLRVRLAAELAARGADGTTVEYALIAVEELAANVVEHGYEDRPDEPLTVTLHTAPDERFVVALWDRAPRFDGADRPPADLAALARARAPRGRGRALAGRIADIHHRSRPGGGNRVTLTLDPRRLRSLEEEQQRAAS